MRKQSRTAIVVWLAVFVALLLISAPLILYHSHFKEQAVGSDPATWGQFGDYVGGVLNPIIGILNLGLFVYISWLVADLAGDHNLQLLVKQRRMEAFELLMSDISKLNLASHNFNLSNATVALSKRYHESRNSTDSVEHFNVLLNHLKMIGESSKVYSDFNETISRFYVRYGYLFGYNFRGDEHKQLVQLTGRVNSCLSNVLLSVTNNKPTEDINDLPKLTDQMLDATTLFVSELRKEIQIKN